LLNQVQLDFNCHISAQLGSTTPLIAADARFSLSLKCDDEKSSRESFSPRARDSRVSVFVSQLNGSVRIVKVLQNRLREFLSSVSRSSARAKSEEKEKKNFFRFQQL
jgi:hypothetical protein